MTESYKALNGREVGSGFDAVATLKGGSIEVIVTTVATGEEWEPMVFDSDAFDSVKQAAIRVASCPSQYAE